MDALFFTSAPAAPLMRPVTVGVPNVLLHHMSVHEVTRSVTLSPSLRGSNHPVSPALFLRTVSDLQLELQRRIRERSPVLQQSNVLQSVDIYVRDVYECGVKRRVRLNDGSVQSVWICGRSFALPLPPAKPIDLDQSANCLRQLEPARLMCFVCYDAAVPQSLIDVAFDLLFAQSRA